MSARLARLLAFVPLLAAAGVLTGPSQAASENPCSLAAPTKLDYVVLASLADSSNGLSLSRYSAAATTRSGSPPGFPSRR